MWGPTVINMAYIYGFTWRYTSKKTNGGRCMEYGRSENWKFETKNVYSK